MSRSRKHQFSCFFLNRASFTLAFNLGVFLLTVLLFSTGAWAKPTTLEQAKAVVQNWIGKEERPMGAALGGRVREVQTFYNGNTAAYYVVYLNPVGLVFVSADDLVEPIIGFVSDATSYDPSPTNPLGALVSRDLVGRVSTARQMMALAPGTEVMPMLTIPQSKARAKWSWLSNSNPSLQSAASVDSISDVRVAPLIQSLWAQGSVNSQNVYNYYTPNNYVTGCVATAMAQLMRYWQYPTAGIGVHPFTIKVDDVSQTANTRGGNGNGGPYNWGNMALDPASTFTGLTMDQIGQAIGALTYDAGLSVNMSYDVNGSGGSSSNVRSAADALTGTFGYSNAKKGYNNKSSITLANLYAMVNPNLQAHRPVLFGIEGTDNTSGKSEGHAIVCDGYGFNASTLYHHLNMGWSGQHNAWYNLPSISLPNVTYTSISACVYNVYASGSGEIIAGQVTDNSSPPNPISGVTVTAIGAGRTYVVTTDANGVYALSQVPSHTNFTITASLSGYTFPAQSLTTGTSIDDSITTGNFWGINFVGTTYVSPYSINFTCDYNSLTYDFNTSPRNDITKESSLDYSEWYNISNHYYIIRADNVKSLCSTGSVDYSVNSTWGPLSAQYPAVAVPPLSGGNELTWKRERLVAVAQKYIGYNYQHHHIPDFDPYSVDPSWPASCPAVAVNNPTSGIDCSNFSSWNYNYGLGIKLDGDVLIQSYPTTPIPGPGGSGSIVPQVIGKGASYDSLIKMLQTGDLLYIKGDPGKPVTHVIMWVGSIGSDPKQGQPLVIDSHGDSVPDSNGVIIPQGVYLRPFRQNEYYYQQFDHAFRIIQPNSVAPAVYLLLLSD